MKGNNRILTDNLSLYDVAHVVFQPKLIQPSELENDFWALYQKFYSSKEIYNRILKSKKSDLIYLLFASKRFKKLVDRRIFPFSSGVNQL